MAFTDNYRTIPGLVAGADLRTAQFKAVKLASTAGQVVLAATSVLTQGFLLQNAPNTGEAAEVAFAGIAKGLAGTSTISIGESLGVNTSSKLMDHATDNRFALGLALEAATAVDDIISVLLRPGGLRY